MLHVAIYQPKIPPNTGNIARQCVGMKAHLHLIGPHDLDLSTRAVKRAGLDYWPHLTLSEHATPGNFLAWLDAQGTAPWLVTKHGGLCFSEAPYRDGDVLVFGNEISGLPAEWHERWPDRRIVIPIVGNVRSYNLANSVAIVLATAFVRVSGRAHKSSE